MTCLCCGNATKRLIESVPQVSPGSSASLELSREIMSLFDQNPLMSDVPLLSGTCSNQEWSISLVSVG